MLGSIDRAIREDLLLSLSICDNTRICYCDQERILFKFKLIVSDVIRDETFKMVLYQNNNVPLQVIIIIGSNNVSQKTCIIYHV